MHFFVVVVIIILFETMLIEIYGVPSVIQPNILQLLFIHESIDVNAVSSLFVLKVLHSQWSGFCLDGKSIAGFSRAKNIVVCDK